MMNRFPLKEKVKLDYFIDNFIDYLMVQEMQIYWSSMQMLSDFGGVIVIGFYPPESISECVVISDDMWIPGICNILRNEEKFTAPAIESLEFHFTDTKPSIYRIAFSCNEDFAKQAIDPYLRWAIAEV